MRTEYPRYSITRQWFQSRKRGSDFIFIVAIIISSGCDDTLLLSRTQPVPDAAVADGGKSTPCREATDCDVGQICSLASGCTEPTCGLPPDEAGLRGEFRSCLVNSTPESTCSSENTCLPLQLALDPETMTYTEVSIDGICFAACDPCTPEACASGYSCIQREDEDSGFCHFGPLRHEGESCSTIQRCAAGLACLRRPPYGIQLSTRCQRRCVPQGITPTETSLVSTGSTSTDCQSDEVCLLGVTGFLGELVYTCRSGTVVPAGHYCFGPNGIYCRDPYQCEFPNLCSPRDCVGGCPAGTECIGQTPNRACIADGVSPLLGPCTQDKHCQQPLRCVITTPPIGSCQP